ncbi:hypothetical protein EXIGLDRAFT_169319 [Exidia glandulosa HHB12029]|uniref:Mid2 domain-containing protein n=1 Tax=Exidia glandulosa HHB12029 TaxID=1314781 RepID=A0A165N6U9_EXIGL|nr:hypothetical protein EXIGLDRAFT_169319 [Exidia glandulosa HHB12029]
MLHHYLYTLSLLATFLATSHAAPAPSSILKRQNGPFTGPNQVTTHNVIPVSGGSVVEDCTITLTPIKVNGQDFVKEERRCVDTFVPDGQTPPAAPPSQSSGTTTTTTTTAPPADSTTTTTTSTQPVETTDSASTTASSTDTAAPPADTSASSSASDTIAPITPPQDTSASDSASSTAGASTTDPAAPPAGTTATVGTDSSAGAATPTSAPDSSANAGSGDNGAVGVSSGSIPVSDAPPASSQPSTAAAQNAADNAAPSQSGVAIPGKKLEVLPIGLGVFAGISVIALIVVGLVTYERTKYRKAFRQRRLAASGAEMGYGGMRYGQQ